MTYGTILSDVYRKLGLPSSPVSATVTRIAAALNETLQEIHSEPGIGDWIASHVPPITFASVASQAVYGLMVPRIDAITERTNNLRLEMRTLDWYRAQEPNPTINTGTPSVWVPLGFQAVAVQPSAAAELFVISTSASDGAATTAYLEGIRTGGYPRTLSVAMNGITGVSFSAAITDFIEVTKFYVSVAAVGTITLRQTSGVGTTLATIPIGQTFARYEGIALWPAPAAAITYYVDSERDLPDMSNANDEPPFPVRFHRVVVDGIVWREFDKSDDSRSAKAEKKYYRGVSQMKYALTCPPDFMPSKTNRRVERSRLGGNYPATDW